MSWQEGKIAAIIGSGPSGLTTAALLAKRGWSVKVFEKRPHPKRYAISSGQRSVIIALMERSVRALKEAGFEVPDRKQGELWKNNVVVCKGVTFVSPETGKSRIPDHNLDLWLAERDALTEALTEVMEDKFNGRIKTQYECEIRDIDFDKRVLTISTQPGIEDSVKYDLLVGADGRSSFIRKMLAQYDSSIRFEEKTIGKSWKSFAGLPILDKAGIGDDEGMTVIYYSTGPTRIVVWPTCHGTVGGYMTQNSSEFQEESNNIQHYKKLIRDAAPYYPQEWLDQTAQELVEAPLGHLGVAWCNKFCGPNTILLGDSANAVTPVLGQGLNSALESCLIFAENLDKHEDVQSACEAFNESRKKDLHALTTLDREAPYRLGARGRFDIKYLARTILQLKIWKHLHRISPRIFSQPESSGMTGTMSYGKVLSGFRRDEAIVKAGIAAVFGVVALSILKLIQTL